MPANLVRVGGGLAAMVGGVLGVVASPMALVFVLPYLLDRTQSEIPSGIYILVGLLLILAWALALGGLAGLYASQQDAVGRLGAVGFVIALSGTVLLVGVLCLQTLRVPVPGVPPLVALIVVQLVTFAASVGWFLFGLATFMARVYPRPAAVLLTVGATINAFVHIAGGEFIVMAAAISWLGLFLFLGRVGSVEEEPARPR